MPDNLRQRGIAVAAEDGVNQLEEDIKKKFKTLFEKDILENY